MIDPVGMIENQSPLLLEDYFTYRCSQPVPEPGDGNFYPDPGNAKIDFRAESDNKFGL
jgi:hypothetical protein